MFLLLHFPCREYGNTLSLPQNTFYRSASSLDFLKVKTGSISLSKASVLRPTAEAKASASARSSAWH